jgi:hypothetical protein
MAHGYLEDGYGTHGEIDPDRDDDRDRRWRGGDDWRDRDRNRGMMFEGRDRDWSDENRWSDRGWRREPGGFGDYSEGRRNFRANPDDHYRSWRDRHMSELDRDYADYCREREQQFHSDFDAWRRQKYSNPQPLRTGMTQSGISHDPSGMTQAAEDSAPRSDSLADPTEEATLGTNSGRSRSRR